jgi:hypothetical protein
MNTRSTALPDEIINAVASDASRSLRGEKLGGYLSKPVAAPSIPPPTAEPELSALCLCNRRLYRIAIPLLYREMHICSYERLSSLANLPRRLLRLIRSVANPPYPSLH